MDFFFTKGSLVYTDFYKNIKAYILLIVSSHLVNILENSIFITIFKIIFRYNLIVIKVFTEIHVACLLKNKF